MDKKKKPLKDIKKKAQPEKTPSVFRTKKEGPLHLIYVGQKHIGHVIEPLVGGNIKRAKNWLAVSKLINKKSTHDDKKTAIDWVTTKSGVSTKIMENVSYDGMKPNEINTHFHQLYHAHLQTGMAPRHFKSPMHIAKMEERNKSLPPGTLSRHIKEGIEAETTGRTEHGAEMRGIEKGTNLTIKKKAQLQVKADLSTSKVSENFVRIRKEAIVREDLFDKDKNRKDPKAGPKPEQNDETGDLEVEVKKTETGQPGDIIVINPKLKKAGPKEKPMMDKPDHKKVPNNP